MNILITGATGFVGKKIAKKLIQMGNQIYVLTRSKKKYEGFLPYPAVLMEQSDLEQSLKEGLKLNAVINLAGETVAQKWNSELKQKIRVSRVSGTRDLIALLRKYNVGLNVFIGASAIGYYGDRGDDELSEESQPAESFLAKVCVDWESETLKAQDISQRVVIQRIGIVLGHDEGALKQMIPPFKNGVGGALANGKAWMSWIHVDDLVQMFVDSLVNTKKNGIYNAVAPTPVRNLIFSQELANALGKKLFLPVPKFAIKTLFGEMADIILSSQKVLPRKHTAEGFSFLYSDLKSALGSIIDKDSAVESKVIFEQWVPKKTSEIFDFFEDEKNLESITPDWLHFKVLNKTTPKIQKGTIINYSLKLYGIPFGWTTLIEDWVPNVFFVDTQKSGPYKKWHHTHEFEDLGQGTIVRDTIRYQIPMGQMGTLFAGWKVDRDVQAIFKYRAEKIKSLFFKN